MGRIGYLAIVPVIKEKALGKSSYQRSRPMRHHLAAGIIIVALAFTLAAPLAAQMPPGSSRFMLYNGCEPVELFFLFSLDDRAEEDGLGDRIRTVAVSRLRAARMFASPGSDPATQIIIRVTAGNSVFAYDIQFYKMLDDPWSGDSALGATYGGMDLVAGTYGDDAGFVVQNLSERIDRFISEYLRVNRVACGD